jgi:hypothetical protein
MDANADPQRGVEQPSNELRRIDQRLIANPQTGAVERRRNLRPNRRTVGKELYLVAEPSQQLRLLGEAGLFVTSDGDVHAARLLEVTCDAEVGDVATEIAKVLPTEAFQERHLALEPREAVHQPVGERGRDEPAVAPACAEAGRLCLEQYDVPRRVATLGFKRGPQAHEAAADDAQIRIRPPGKRRLGL